MADGGTTDRGDKYGAESITWDLTDLYRSPDDPAIEADLDRADSLAGDLSKRYRGEQERLAAGDMADLLEAYESIIDLSGRVGTYSYLLWSTNSEDPARGALLQRATERSSRLHQRLLFVELQWAALPEDRAQMLLDAEELAHYRHWLEVTRLYKPYLLSEAEERILSEKGVTGRGAWVRFFGEVHGSFRYDWEGERIPQASMLNKLYDRHRSVRRKAAASFTAGLRDMLRTNTYIFNTLLADKASSDRLRSYPGWISARNLENQVDDCTVQALVEAVTSRYDIVARYYGLKRRLLGLDELLDYDRYAPLPAGVSRHPWDEARESVLSAYHHLHPRAESIARRFFDERWIDAAVAPGKRGGAYSHGAVPSVHPYIFLNYEGTSRDMMTLAHEMGHGIHQMLSREQGVLQADTPLTTAETASVFGEMLLFQDLLTREDDPQARLAMLAGKIEDSFATVFRQIAMNRFEDAIHGERRSRGELTSERFSDLWMDTQRAMFGESVTLTEDYRHWWSYIPHFIGTPGYVYAYAFGELLVLALFDRYREMGDAFSPLYLDLLSAGGSRWPHELVEPFGVDLRDPGFWSRGLELLDDLVGQAEELAGT